MEKLIKTPIEFLTKPIKRAKENLARYDLEEIKKREQISKYAACGYSLALVFGFFAGSQNIEAAGLMNTASLTAFFVSSFNWAIQKERFQKIADTEGGILAEEIKVLLREQYESQDTDVINLTFENLDFWADQNGLEVRDIVKVMGSLAKQNKLKNDAADLNTISAVKSIMSEIKRDYPEKLAVAIQLTSDLNHLFDIRPLVDANQAIYALNDNMEWQEVGVNYPNLNTTHNLTEVDQDQEIFDDFDLSDNSHDRLDLDS
jgi:hypothetical protein